MTKKGARLSKTKRRAVQRARGSLREVAARHGINVKTVMRWRARGELEDLPRPGRQPCALSLREQAIIVFVRRHTFLPLDDCLYGLQPSIPHLSRASLYRCLRRHGIEKLPEEANVRPNSAGLGAVRLDIGRIKLARKEVYLLFAIDLEAKLVFGDVVHACRWSVVQRFLRRVERVFPYPIVSFAAPTCAPFGAAFRRFCQSREIDVLPGSERQLWTAAQAAKMDHFMAAARDVVFYETLQEADASLQSFYDAHNFRRKLRILNGMAPFEYVLRTWEAAPDKFRADPRRTVPRASQV